MRIIVKEHSSCDYSYRSPEQYGDWEERNDYYIDAVFTADKDYKTSSYEEGFLIPDDSQYAYVIHMVYDTGDSFGRSYGHGVILGVFGNKEVADEALEQFHNQKKEWTFKIKDDNGNEISIHNPGAGYFEHIQYIELNTYPVRGPIVKKRLN